METTILEKLQFVEERMQALEQQLKLTKMEALEQRARAEVAETWLKIKNRKIVFMEEMEDDEVEVPSLSKTTESWDTVTIPSPARRTSLPSVERRTSLLSERRTSLPSPVNRRTSLPSVPSPVARRASKTESPKRASLARQCWPVIQIDPSDIQVVSDNQVVKAVQGYEKLFLTRKENPLWTKEILCEHAIHLGVETYSKKKEQILEDMRAAIESGTVVSNPIYILHLYEKRLDDAGLISVNKETIEEHCKYYDIVTDGKRKNRLWDELREAIRCARA